MFEEHFAAIAKACEGLNTPWELLNYLVKDREANDFTSGHAIDIAYKCPGKAERASTWLFPDEDMFFQDECVASLCAL